jgi:hypothetical protein
MDLVRHAEFIENLRRGAHQEPEFHVAGQEETSVPQAARVA